MSYPVKNGQASVVLRFKLLDSSSTVGAGLTGLSSASTGLIISTIADNEATATAYTVAGSTIETITTLGTYAAPTATKCRFKEVDSTNHKGVYEFQIADARFAVSNAKSLLISVLGATNLAQADFVVPLPSDDPYVAKPSNYASLSIDGSGRVDVIKVAGTTQTARDLGASVLLSAGTGTGQLDFTSGVVKANAVQLLGTAWLTPGTAGTPDVNVKLWNALTTVALPLAPATAGRTLVVDAAGLADANVVKVGPTGSGTAQTAGDIMADTNDIQTRLPAALIGGRIDASVGAMATDSIAAAALSAAAAEKAADALLGRNVSGGSNAGRLVKQALHFLRNKWTIVTGTLTVYDTDDSTSSWTASVGTDAAADPIVSNDPA